MLAASLWLAALVGTTDASYDYYKTEFEIHFLESKDPMAKLIDLRLADSIFDTTSETEFLSRLRELKRLVQENPERVGSLKRLDAYLQRRFEEKMKSAKKKRWLYAAGGAVVGALIAIPIAKAINGKNILWIAVPSGALAGGGLGFLLGHLLEVPKYSYTSQVLTEDIDDAIDRIDELLKN